VHSKDVLRMISVTEGKKITIAADGNVYEGPCLVASTSHQVGVIEPKGLDAFRPNESVAKSRDSGAVQIQFRQIGPVPSASSIQLEHRRS
jgi:hypothetical protein